MKRDYNLKTVTGFRELTARDYSSMDFVFPGFPLGCVGSLVSPGGTGKSFFALQRALEVAIGRDLKRGGVLYLPAEDHPDEIGKRLQAISRAFELTPQEKDLAGENFILWPLLGEAPDLLEEQKEGRPLLEAISSIASGRALDDDPLRLIIFDTLRRFSYADENDGGAMSKVLSAMETLCKRLSCSCIFLHHTSKSAALNGQVDTQQAARGSSVLTDNIRYQEFLRVMTKEEAEKLCEDGYPVGEERKKYVEWGVSKQNYGQPVDNLWLKRNDDGVLLPVILEKAESSKKRSSKDEI